MSEYFAILGAIVVTALAVAFVSVLIVGVIALIKFVKEEE